MRLTDFARLTEPYPEDHDAPDSEPMAALGMKLPNWTRLEAEIMADFTGQPPYGIGWWAPDPGTSRRILISDQLYACAVSVSGNITEAALHWLEFLDCSERDSDRFADAVKIANGQLRLAAPRPRNSLDQLSRTLVRMHVSGVVRALASAFDCLGGAIIGVAALPMNILRADFAGMRSRLNKISGAANDGTRIQMRLATSLEANIDAAGPKGWLEWALDFRNMLVHRGRRIELGQFVPRAPVLYGANAQRLVRSRRVTHLPCDPGRSDIEVWHDPPRMLVLSEDEEQTLSGLLSSTKSLIETTGKDLLDVWHWRREHPGSLRQPAAQWPNGRSIQSTGFNGYAPGTFELAPSMAVEHPDVARRFRTAALDDPSRHQWATFD